MTTKNHAIPHIPAIDGRLWHITGYPELGDLAPGQDHEVVDHAIWQSEDAKMALLGLRAQDKYWPAFLRLGS